VEHIDFLNGFCAGHSNELPKLGLEGKNNNQLSL